MGTFQNRYNPRSAVEAAYQEWKIARDQADTSRRWTQLYDGEVEPGTRF